jgi:hypothetical protein
LHSAWKYSGWSPPPFRLLETQPLRRWAPSVPIFYQYIPISSKLSDALDVQIQKAIESLTPAQITAHIAAKTVPEIDFSPIIGDIDAPSSCSTPPSWVTSGGSPPSAQQSGPSTGETV